MNNTTSRTEYLRRIHKLQDYIEENISNQLALSELAGVVGFSKYHFHKIFSAITKESLFHYVNRIKLERAAAYLIHRPKTTVTYVASHYGFSDSAVFSRSFKKHYACSPTEYRSQNSKKCKDITTTYQYNGGEIINRKGKVMKIKANVEAVTIEEMRVIYVRYTGNYQELASAMPGMMEKLFGFATGHNLLVPGETKVLSVYHDNPGLTNENQLRTSLCMSVPTDAVVDEDSDIGSMNISGKFAVGHFEVCRSEYGDAWDYMYGEWLPDSGYQPRDAFPFEVYLSEPSVNPQQKQLLDIYLPIEPLGAL